MKLSLRTKLVCFTFSIVLLVGVAISLYAIYREQREILITFEREGHDITSILSEIVAAELYALDIRNMRNHLNNARVNPDIRYTYVTDLDGIVLADGSRESPLLGKPLTDPFSAQIRVSNVLASTVENQILKVGRPIFIRDGSRLGYMYVGFSLDRAYQDIQTETRANLTITVLCLGLGAILAVILATRMSRPISEMVSVSKEIGEGKFGARLSAKKRHDELGVLAQTINQMAISLDTTTISKDYLDGILNSLMDALIVLSPMGVIEMVNPATLNLLDYEEHELIGQPFRKVLQRNGDELGGPMENSDIEELMKEGSVSNIETAYRTKNGRYIPVLFSGSLLHDKDGSIRGLICVARDITDRKRAEEAREKLARDLHDGVLQSLYSVGLNLEACKPLLREDFDTAHRRMDQAIVQLNSVMHEVRNFIAGVEPDVSLKEDFEAIVMSLPQATGDGTQEGPCFHIHLSRRAVEQLTESQAAHLLNIIREGMSNIIRHARAKNGMVFLDAKDNLIRLEVTDDGVGFDIDHESSHGRGLTNLEARARSLGGHLHISSRPGSGTHLVLDIPSE